MFELKIVFVLFSVFLFVSTIMECSYLVQLQTALDFCWMNFLEGKRYIYNDLAISLLRFDIVVNDTVMLILLDST
mgnify:CR=1 FL=1